MPVRTPAHESYVRVPWLVAMAVMVLFIWGNSLVPGTESGGLSLTVVSTIRDALDALGIPSAWVTNFLVRKAAHFTEYAVLGILAARTFNLRRGAPAARILFACAVLVLVPSIDETIQLFVAGRSGQVTDVLLDCCGAATGAALAALLSSLRHP